MTRTMNSAESRTDARIKVLLVDDEDGYVGVLAKRLAWRNFEVVSAHSGAEGIRTLRGTDFHVAVLDLKMEDMDGIEVLKVFKKVCPQMEVIMLTGHGSEQAARDGIAFGAYHWLMKPCELDELVQVIREAYEGRRKA